MRAERLGSVAHGGRLARVRAPRLALRAVLPGTPWGREWLVTLSHPRALIMRVAVPLLLAVPLVAGGAPTFWAAMLLSVLVAMVGAVGSGITLARARASGHLARLAITPGAAWSTVGAWVLAAAAVDLMQLTPALGVAALGGGGGWAAAGALLLCAAAALLVANVLGCALAMLAGGAAEVLLDVSVVLAPLLFLGGLFTGVPRTGWRWPVARIDPFSHLHSSLIGALGGSRTFGAAEDAAWALLWAALALAALVPLSGQLLRRR
ncbi:MAG TPA: ABC transporter permease [Candidatus Dormibacteraeota bacterium]|nr:ABC transporter permease [Candidatus Dormibacteraeota bacterium]